MQEMTPFGAPARSAAFRNEPAGFADASYRRRVRTEDDGITAFQRDESFINGGRCGFVDE